MFSMVIYPAAVPITIITLTQTFILIINSMTIIFIEYPIKNINPWWILPSCPYKYHLLASIKPVHINETINVSTHPKISPDKVSDCQLFKLTEIIPGKDPLTVGPPIKRHVYHHYLVFIKWKIVIEKNLSIYYSINIWKSTVLNHFKTVPLFF